LTRVDETAKGESQEFQLNIATDRTDWVLGAYYYNQRSAEHREADIDLFDPSNPPNTVTPLAQDLRSTANGTAYALFADVNYRVSEPLRLTGGLRLNHETKNATVEDVGNGPFATPLSLKEVAFDDISGRLGIDYRWDKNTLVYGSVSKGFKSGGISPFINPGSGEMETYKPESLLAYEVGMKRALPANRGQLNVTAFYYDYSDIQVRITDPAADAIRNAATAKVFGAEAQLDMKLFGSFGIDLTAGWLSAKYNTFMTTDASGKSYDFTGNTLPLAPKVSYAVAATLDKQALFGGLLTGRLEYTFRDKVYFEPSNTTRPGQENSFEDGIGLVNFSLSVTKPRAPWTVTLSGRNLTDKEYLDNSIFGLAIPGQPRTWNVRYDYRF
jgi:iron complex outermembrane receptor protein